jgi:putative glycosyltransferase (TIGR04372 family)
MGVDVLQPLKSNNSMIIDYANSSIRSEFMDIYLASKCNFGVSTDFGIDEVMVCFRKPIVYIGVVPFGGVTTSNKNSLVIFKEHIDINTNKKLSISEIFDRKLSSAYNKKLFSENNVRLIHNTPEQIKDAVIEMDKRLKGIWKETEEEKILQNNFWSNFRKNCKKDDFQNHEKRHGIVHGEFASKVSLKFLKENKHLLD